MSALQVMGELTHQEKQIPMDGDCAAEVRILDGARTGDLPRVMTEGF